MRSDDDRDDRQRHHEHAGHGDRCQDTIEHIPQCPCYRLGAFASYGVGFVGINVRRLTRLTTPSRLVGQFRASRARRGVSLMIRGQSAKRCVPVRCVWLSKNRPRTSISSLWENSQGRRTPSLGSKRLPRVPYDGSSSEQNSGLHRRSAEHAQACALHS